MLGGWRCPGLQLMTTQTRWSRTWSDLSILDPSITALFVDVTWRIVFTRCLLSFNPDALLSPGRRSLFSRPFRSRAHHPL